MSEPTAPAEQVEPAEQQSTPAPSPEPTFDAKYVEKLRAEAGKYRTERNDSAAKLNAVLGALGLGDRQEDPAAAVERYKAEARAAQVEAAIVLNAGDADPKRLLDSVSFRDSIKDIDPLNSTAIQAAIRAAVDANPALAAPSPGPAGWGDAVAGRTPPTHTTQDAQALSVLGF